jgi:hypothetical protein
MSDNNRINTSERKQIKCKYQSLIWPIITIHCCVCEGCEPYNKSDDILDYDPDPIAIKRLKIQIFILCKIFAFETNDVGRIQCTFTKNKQGIDRRLS